MNSVRPGNRSTWTMAFPGVSGRHGDGERLQRQRLFFHGDITVGIGRRAPNNGDIDGRAL